TDPRIHAVRRKQTSMTTVVKQDEHSHEARGERWNERPSPGRAPPGVECGEDTGEQNHNDQHLPVRDSIDGSRKRKRFPNDRIIAWQVHSGSASTNNKVVPNWIGSPFGDIRSMLAYATQEEHGRPVHRVR